MQGSNKGWKILFYEDHRGNSPPLDFINGLPAKERAKVDYGLRLLCEFGLALGMPHARRIEDELWELRPGKNRLLYCVYSERQVIVLHGFRKTTRETPEKHKRIARARIQDIFEA